MPFPVKVDTWVLTAGATQSTANQTPTAGTKNGTTVTSAEFDNIPVAGARSIYVQAIEADGNSSDLDINIHASYDGTNYDTASHPYATFNYDASTDGNASFLVSPGPKFIRVRTDEGAGLGTIDLTVTVIVTWE